MILFNKNSRVFEAIQIIITKHFYRTQSYDNTDLFLKINKSFFLETVEDASKTNTYNNQSIFVTVKLLYDLLLKLFKNENNLKQQMLKNVNDKILI